MAQLFCQKLLVLLFNTSELPSTTVQIFLLKTTLSSVDNIKKARDAGIDSLLGSTANLVGTLVEGQASSRRQGEQIATNIDLAKQNIKEMRSKIGQLPPPSRRIVVEQLNKLENIVLERAAQLAGQVFD